MWGGGGSHGTWGGGLSRMDCVAGKQTYSAAKMQIEGMHSTVHAEVPTSVFAWPSWQPRPPPPPSAVDNPS